MSGRVTRKELRAGSASRFHRRRNGRLLRCEHLEARIALNGQSLLSSVAGLELTSDQITAFNATQLEWRGQPIYAKQDEWILKLSMTGGPSALQVQEAQQLLTQQHHGLQVVKHLAASGTFLIQSDPGLSEDVVRGALTQVPGFAYFEPNFLIIPQATLPNDPFLNSQWWLENNGQTGGVIDADIDAARAWDTTTGSGSVVIGVVDSGVNYLHPDLIGNIWINPGEIPGDGIDNDGNGYIDDVYGWDFADNNNDPMDISGHGTSVAGIIAASGNNGIGVAGVNWDAQIMILKVESNLGGGWANTIEALNYATMMRVNYGINVRVTNHSYSTPFYSEAFLEAVEANRAADMLITASAGNFSLDNDVFPAYPSTYDVDNVIAVAATDHRDQLALFSNFGANSVEVGAPGVSVYTTAVGGGYRLFGGTSAAAPVTAGIAALLWDAAPYATYDQIRDAILYGVDLVPALDGIVITGGRVNAGNSMELLGLRIVDVSPDAGAIVDGLLHEFTVSFSEPVDASVLAAADFRVGGLPADAFDVHSDAITFSYLVSPLAAEGVYEVELAGGVVAALVNPTKSNLRLNTKFRYDTVPLTPTATVPADGAVVDLPLDTLVVTFNEAIDPASIGVSNLQLSQGTVTKALIVDAFTVAYSVAGLVSEGNLHWGFGAGAVRDLNGNPMSHHMFQAALNIPLRNLQFKHVVIPGALVYESADNAGVISQPSEVDEYAVYLETGETLTARVRPISATASLTIELAPLGIVVQGGPGQSVILPTNSAAVGTYRIRVSSDEATSYVLDAVRNADVEWVDSSVSAPLVLQPSWAPDDARRFAVLGSRAGNIIVSDTDLYGIDLTESAGKQLSIVLRREASAASSPSVQLLAPDGITVLATATASGASNYSVAIANWTVPEGGTYFVRVSGSAAGRYLLVATESLQIEREPNDVSPAAAQVLSPATPIVGQIGVPAVAGQYQLQIDAAASHIELVASLGAVGLPPTLATPQRPGSLDAVLRGTIPIHVGDGSIQIGAMQLDPDAKSGPFTPSTSSADFAGTLSLLGLPLPFTIVNSRLGVVTDRIDLADNGTFSTTDVQAIFNRGDLFADLLGNFVDLGLNTMALDQATISGTFEVLPSQLKLTTVLVGAMRQYDPMLQLELNLQFTATIVATAALPVVNDDQFAMHLNAGESYVVALEPLFASPEASPLNTLDTSFVIRSADNTVLATSDANGMAQFVAPGDGVYRVVVVAQSGHGDYLLRLTVDESVTQFQLTGPDSGIRGLQQSFTIQTEDESAEHTFVVDWNGDGVYDETVTGGTIQLQHVFPHAGSYVVRVAALNSQGIPGDAVEHAVSIAVVGTLVFPEQPTITHFVFGGSPGDDFYFFGRKGDGIRAVGHRDNGIAGVTEFFVPGITGSVIAFGFGGDDILWATFSAGTNAVLDGGEGDDILIGGNGVDVLVGGAGNDVLIKFSGFGLLYGGSGSNTLVHPFTSVALKGDVDIPKVLNGGTITPLLSSGGAAALPRLSARVATSTMASDFLFSSELDELIEAPLHRKAKTRL